MPPSRTVDGWIAEGVRRAHILYESYAPERVVCSFSGGKDSAACLECCAIALRERGRGERVHAQFWDDEIVSPDTLAYLERVRERPDVDLEWLCVPTRYQFLFAFEGSTGWWHSWDPDERERWARPMPAHGISDPPWKRERSTAILEYIQYEAAHHLPEQSVFVIGLRVEESPARRTILRTTDQPEPWLMHRPSGGVLDKAMLIEDWPTETVWRAIARRGWDWSREYMRMWQGGIVDHRQLRVSQPLGEEASNRTHAIRKAYPGYWRRICRRFPDAVNIVRYAHSAALGRGRAVGTATSDQILDALRDLPADKRIDTARSIRASIAANFQLRAGMPSSKILRAALRGDSKAKRLSIGHRFTGTLKALDRGRYYRYWSKRGDGYLARTARGAAFRQAKRRKRTK